MDRREFMKGAALGVGAGVLGSMGLYSYSPLRRAFLPEVKRGTADIGVCKSVKVTNISETSWFDNGIFMNDVTGAGGLLVDQYTFNWAPFGNGKGVGKGTFEEGLKRIKHLLPHKIDEAWAIAKENCVHADNAGGYSCLVEIESMEGDYLAIVTLAFGEIIRNVMSTWTTTGASPWSPSTIPTSTSTRPTPSTRRARNT